MPALRRIGINIETMWFQQDGATPHTAKHVLSWLHESFGDNFISFKTEKKKWPPHPPDLNPLDFFLWGYLRDSSTRLNQQLYSVLPQLCKGLTKKFNFSWRCKYMIVLEDDTICLKSALSLSHKI